ncbi:MAG: DUF4440 domain-containing protein [Proteobacteria bacterium]|nr:DUF4440 domain-containing protein [Pseudomonadota bacterium]
MDSKNADLAGTDEQAIRALLARQFDTLCWTPGDSPDYARVLADFAHDATLYASRRPAQSQTADEFCARLERLRVDGTLATFHERMMGATVQVFGNVAVALAACEMTENEHTKTREVSGFLLLKDDGRWRIAAQAWDMAREGLPIPPALGG